MQRVGHVHAFPPVGLDRKVNDISGLRLDSHKIQNMRQRYADPLGDIRPTLFTLHHGDLAASRVALQLRKRKRRGPIDQAVDGESPVRKSSSLKAFERVIRWG